MVDNIQVYPQFHLTNLDNVVIKQNSTETVNTNLFVVIFQTKPHITIVLFFKPLCSFISEDSKITTYQYITFSSNGVPEKNN